MKCVACGQSECVPGLLDRAIGFQPGVTGWRMFSSFFRVRSVACLNCGFITSYLSETDTEALRLKADDQQRLRVTTAQK